MVFHLQKKSCEVVLQVNGVEKQLRLLGCCEISVHVTTPDLAAFRKCPVLRL